MAKAGKLKEKVDRIKKKLSAGGEKLDAARKRALRKSLKRTQRHRRRLIQAQVRAEKKRSGGAEAKGEGAPAAG